MKLTRQSKSAIIATTGYFIALEVMLTAAILYWPSFRENTAALKVLAGPLPMLRDMVTQLEDKGAIAYVISQHFFKGCSVLGVAAATLFAAGAVAGEAHRGTLELMLLRPITRRRLLTERYLGGLLQLSLPILLTTATIPMLLARVNESAEMGPLMRCAVHETLFISVLYSATFLWSTLGRMPLKITFAMLVFAIFNFAIYMVKTVTHYSLFRLADIEVMLDVYEKGVPIGTWACFVGASLALFGASLAVFERRVP